MPNLQLEFKYNSSFYDVEGDQIAWAWYIRGAVHMYAGVPSCGWASVDGPYSM
ncbi:hypothetical protein BDR06DRAFT_960262 [Suillus hirtellus]|nr:hypothetical protein BDR06DRAFT_960262 [Suillus hirtellus]